MKHYVVSPEAEADLREIWHYYAQEVGMAVADRLRDELVNAFEGLVDFPGKGHKRPDLTARPVRFFLLYQYMIVYREAANVQIVAILHSKRDVKRLLAEREQL